MDDIYKVDENGNAYSLEKSFSGSNAFYIQDCATAGNTAAYCACLKKGMDHQNGRLATMYSQCGDAIDRNSCKAARMRREEVAAGHALFYISRARINAQYESDKAISDAKLASMYAPKKSWGVPVSKPKPAQADTTGQSFDIGDSSYATAINMAIAEGVKSEPEVVVVAPEKKEVAPIEVKQVALPPASSLSVAVKVGMSLIEMARKRSAANQLNK